MRPTLVLVSGVERALVMHCIPPAAAHCSHLTQAPSLPPLACPLYTGVPRANKAVTKEKPQGSDSKYSRDDLTVLQQHVAFFDRCGGKA